MEISKPTWRFPPRNGGIDYVNDPSSAHFSDAPIPKLVRELIQNSLDAKQDGLAGPITVTFSETEVQRGLIGGAALHGHLESCLDRANTDKSERLAKVYSNALAVIRRQVIPCLKVLDTGTTGLNDARWKALVVQEGAVSKGSGAPGGSFGFGKNAILNVSDIQTVFYSTRLVEGRKGRVEKLQGKATLIGHPDPDGSGDDLQHIGFYNEQDNGPVTGKNIPQFFRLEKTGASVYIMGFNPHSPDWVAEVVTAVIENFFYAIHHQRLAVEVTPKDGDSIRIDHQTIDQLFGKLQPINRNAVHYYRAIRDLSEDDVEHTSRFSKGGGLRAYVAFEEGAPRRVAHINRNGMLITDSREQKDSPLAPRGRSLWPDFVVVVVPDTDAVDSWLRRMENPSHDSLSSGQLLNEDDRRESDEELRQMRQALREIIDRKAQIDRYGEASNLDELADIFPDAEDGPGTKTLTTKVIESQVARHDTKLDEGREGGGLGEDTDGGEGGGGSNGSGSNGNRGGQDADGDASVRSQEQSSELQRVRYIPLSSSEAIIAFNPVYDPPRWVRLSLAPAGADPDPRHAAAVAIIEATRIGEEGVPLTVTDGQVTFMPDSSDRVTIRIVADGNLDGPAFRLR